MSSDLTNSQNRLFRKYLAYELLTNLWFISAVWLYFYRIFITDQQIGILDGFAFAIGLIAEVPSGALADRFGRARMVKVGQFLAGSGLLIQAFGSSFVPFFVGQTITMIGVSFISGADEALFFSNFNFDRIGAQWRKITTRTSQVALIGTITATIAGGWFNTINPRIPWILTGLSFISSVLILWPIKDNHISKAAKGFWVELREHLWSIKEGFAEFRNAKFSLYIPIIITVQGLFYTAGWGILRLILLSRFNFSPAWGSFVIASCALITIGILTLMHKYADNLSEKWVLTLIAIGAAFGLLLSLADIGIWGYFVIFMFYAGEHVLHPFMSEVLNNRANENQRATVLSVASFLRALPYVVLAPIIGYLNMHGQLNYFLITWPFLILLTIFIYLSLKKTDNHINITKEENKNTERVPDLYM